MARQADVGPCSSSDWPSRHLYTCMLPPMSMEPWAATTKRYTNVEVTLALVRVPTQRPLAPSFTSVLG